MGIEYNQMKGMFSEKMLWGAGKTQWSNLSIPKEMDFGSGRGVQAFLGRKEGRLKRLPGICWRDRGRLLKEQVYGTLELLRVWRCGDNAKAFKPSVRRVKNRLKEG